MVVNHAQAAPGPFLSGIFWRILARKEGPCGCWPRPVKCVNEPKVYRPLALGLGLKFGRCAGCEKLDSRVVSVPAGRKCSVWMIKSDRTQGEPKSIELRFAKSNRREG